MRAACWAFLALAVVGCGTEIQRLPGARSELFIRIHTPPSQDVFGGVATLRLVLEMPDGERLTTDIDVSTSELTLAGPPGEGVVLRLEGLGLEGQEVLSSGQSFPFDLDPDRPAMVDVLFARRGEFARLLGGLGHARFGHTASVLADGRVLIFGGASQGDIDSPSGFPPPEIYDLTTQTSCAFLDELCPAYGSADRRIGHTASAAPDGQTLVFGGEDESGELVGTVLLFDPEVDGFREFTNYDPARVPPRVHHQAEVFRADGGAGEREVVLISGGELASGTERIATDKALLFDLQAMQFVRTDLSMLHARRHHTLTAFGEGLDRVLVAGGEGATGLLNAAELFDGQTFQAVEPVGPDARSGLVQPRVHHGAVGMPDGVLIVGGDNRLESLDAPEMFLLGGEQGTGFFALEVGSAHTGHQPRRGAVVRWLPQGGALYAGGERLDGFGREVLDTAELLRIQPGNLEATFSGLAPLGQFLSFPGVTRLPGDAVLLTGGMQPGDPEPLASSEVWYYNP